MKNDYFDNEDQMILIPRDNCDKTELENDLDKNFDKDKGKYKHNFNIHS